MGYRQASLYGAFQEGLCSETSSRSRRKLKENAQNSFKMYERKLSSANEWHVLSLPLGDEKYTAELTVQGRKSASHSKNNRCHDTLGCMYV